jgi:hypothetical protein
MTTHHDLLFNTRVSQRDRKMTAMFFGRHPQDKGAFRKIIYTHWRRYPLMEMQDLYKLVQQAAMGNTHLGSDHAKIYIVLREEMAQIQDSPHEPLLEELTPDGSVVRVNLRPFKALQGAPDALWQAMIQSAKTFHASPGRLAQYWQYIEEMAVAGILPYETQALQAYMQQRQAQGYPAVHHSASYRAHYHPAYRVILKQFMP